MIATPPRELVEAARAQLRSSEGAIAEKLAVSDDVVTEGDWVHLLVYPTQSGVSALDFVDEIELIERRLREHYGAEILIVPAKP